MMDRGRLLILKQKENRIERVMWKREVIHVIGETGQGRKQEKAARMVKGKRRPRGQSELVEQRGKRGPLPRRLQRRD